MPAARVTAIALAALTVASVAGAAVLLHAAPDRENAATLALLGVVGLVNAACGLVVAARRPRLWIGALLCLIGFIATQQTLQTNYDHAYARGVVPPPGPWDLTLSQGIWMVIFLPAAFLLLLFPDGHLRTPRYRWVARGLIVVPIVFDVCASFDTTPFAAPYQNVPHAFQPSPVVQHAFGVLGVALLPVFLALLVFSALAVIQRARRTGDPAIKWLILGALTLPGTLIAGWIVYLLFGDSDVVVIGLAVTGIAIPVATAIGMLRHDLYDVDRAISFAVTYGAVTAGVVALYSILAFLGGLVAGHGSAVVAAAATALCAAVLAPFRRRLQRFVDRKLYPARQAALAAIETLRARTRTGDAEPEQLEQSLQSALRDPSLRVGYLLPGERDLVDSAGEPLGTGGRSVAPIRVGETEIGALVRGTTGSRELIRELADAAALLVEVVRLRIHSARTLREVEESRGRLLAAGYEERRRLERDLHDGAQQRLVALGMGLRLAQRHLSADGLAEPDGLAELDGVLEHSVAELSLAVAELRQIAGGLRPSSLDDGLGPALSHLAGNMPMAVTLDVCPDELPDDVATTAYYVVSEALANAVKHARASAVGLTVSRADGHVAVRVEDDGRGGARVRPGAGLAGLTDRVAAAGGVLRVDSRSGRGTRIEAVLPLGAPA